MLFVLDLNLTKWKKVICIPPICNNNCFVANFRWNIDLFNSQNNTLYWKILVFSLIHVRNILNTADTVGFFKKRYLQDNEKLCRISICKLTEIILQNCLSLSKFPAEWKMTNVVERWKRVHIKLSSIFSSTGVKISSNSFFRTFFFQKTSSYCQNNLGLGKVIPVPTSYFKLHPKFFLYLIIVTKSLASFFIYLRRLIEFGKKVWNFYLKDFLSCRKQRVELVSIHHEQIT